MNGSDSEASLMAVFGIGNICHSGPGTYSAEVFILWGGLPGGGGVVCMGNMLF